MSIEEQMQFMSDEELKQKADELYKSVKKPSDSLKQLYNVWFVKGTPTRMHSETIYKLCIFEKETMGEEAWNSK